MIIIDKGKSGDLSAQMTPINKPDRIVIIDNHDHWGTAAFGAALL
jgi:hypothetical protein